MGSTSRSTKRWKCSKRVSTPKVQPAERPPRPMKGLQHRHWAILRRRDLKQFRRLQASTPLLHTRGISRARSFDLEVTPWAPTRLTSCISHPGPEESSGASTLPPGPAQPPFRLQSSPESTHKPSLQDLKLLTEDAAIATGNLRAGSGTATTARLALGAGTWAPRLPGTRRRIHQIAACEGIRASVLHSFFFIRRAKVSVRGSQV